MAAMLSLSLEATSGTERVTTAYGAGADVEMREQTNSGANTVALNTRTSSETNRNEIIGLRFDLADYSMAAISNVSLNLIAYRDDASTRIVNLFGVAAGTVAAEGSYTTEDWNESAMTTFGSLPGLLPGDGDLLTQGIDSNHVTFLGQITVAGGSVPAGGVHSFTGSRLTEFVRGYTGTERITFLLAAGNNSTGQFRVASREATALDPATGIAGGLGDFAPDLEFDAGGDSPASALLITNTIMSGSQLVLEGSGGSPHGSYAVLSSVSGTLAMSNWSVLTTNAFDAKGNFAVTNPPAPAEVQRFFRLYTLELTNPDGPIGFATLNGGISGGAGGLTQTVATASAFVSAVGAAGPRVVLVDGLIELDGSGTGSASVTSDKTVLGLGTNALISGRLQINGKSNVIIRNLTITNNGAPGGLDGISILGGSQRVWVDHCTFVDCSDGEVDITQGADYVTVSWCKFGYLNQTEHKFVNLIAASDLDAGNYRITFHHNWWSAGCNQRMPMSRYGTVHLFNNYYFAPGNSYCSNARTNAQFLSEHNYYRQVDDPIYKESNGRIRTVGNIYQSCTGQVDPGTNGLDAVLSPPPYAYLLEVAASVPTVVTNGAGVGKGPFVP